MIISTIRKFTDIMPKTITTLIFKYTNVVQYKQINLKQNIFMC